MKKVRDEKKSKEKEDIQNIPFPPDIQDGKEKDCIKKFIEHTSPKSMQFDVMYSSSAHVV